MISSDEVKYGETFTSWPAATASFRLACSCGRSVIQTAHRLVLLAAWLKPPSTKYSSSSPCTPSSSRRTIATSTAAGLARHELTHRVARAAEVTEAVHRAQEGPLRA